MKEGFARIYNDDGSVTFAATFNVAEALRADPEVLLTLEDVMRNSFTDITGLPDRPSWGVRAWCFLRLLCRASVYVFFLVLTARILFWVAVTAWGVL